MLADRYEGTGAMTANSDVSKYGWLVYLRESDKNGRGVIKPNATSFRGLIQSRNLLAASLKRLIDLEDLSEGDGGDWIPSLPAPIDRERMCSRCPHILTCGIFRGER